MLKRSLSRSTFLVANYTFLAITGFICFLPFVHVISISFSSAVEAAAGHVFFWPKGFHTFAYSWMFKKDAFWNSLMMSLYRVLLGYTINMLIVLFTAYPLSKEVRQFRWRTVYVWYFFFTAVFSGGMIPLFLMVKYTGAMNTIWALVLPSALPVWNMILMINFFRHIPKEIEEAALIDGAGHARILFAVFIPLSLPAIATISLFTALNHWNSWFDGLIYLNDTRLYPFQTYLRTLVMNTGLAGISSITELKDRLLLADRNIKAAQIAVGTVPILLIYPFLQRYFTKGIVIGSVKG